MATKGAQSQGHPFVLVDLGEGVPVVADTEGVAHVLADEDGLAIHFNRVAARWLRARTDQPQVQGVDGKSYPAIQAVATPASNCRRGLSAQVST